MTAHGGPVIACSPSPLTALVATIGADGKINTHTHTHTYTHTSTMHSPIVDVNSGDEGSRPPILYPLGNPPQYLPTPTAVARVGFLPRFVCV